MLCVLTNFKQKLALICINFYITYATFVTQKTTSFWGTSSPDSLLGLRPWTSLGTSVPLTSCVWGSVNSWNKTMKCAVACCIDCHNAPSLDILCNHYASDGQCESTLNYAYMYAYCRRACLNCDADTGWPMHCIARSGTDLISLLIMLLLFLLGRPLQKKFTAPSFLFGLEWNLTWNLRVNVKAETEFYGPPCT